MDAAKSEYMAIFQDLWSWPFFKGSYRVLYSLDQMLTLVIGYSITAVRFDPYSCNSICDLFNLGIGSFTYKI